jgi:hypothetical protein
VEVRRDGRQVFYRANAEGLRPIYEWTSRFERYWQNQLRRVKERAEQQQRRNNEAKAQRRPS